MGRLAAAPVADLVVEVLGPARVCQGDEVVEVSAIQRRLLARLAITAPHPVAVSDLWDALWDGEPPATARAALNNQISRLRARLGNDALETSPAGVALALVTDAGQVTALVTVAEVALEAGRAQEAADLADAAVVRWRGTPLEELGGQRAAEIERRRLDEVRRAAENLRLSAALELGRLAWAVPESERLVGETPHDEERWALLVRSLDRAGRRGDALGAYERARRTLADDLGLDPGPRLQHAQVEVLRIGPGTRPATARRLVGRQALLQAALQTATGGGRLVLSGEAGAGKTALLRAVAARLRRANVAVGLAEPAVDADAPMAVLADLLESIGATRDPAADPVGGFAAAVASVGAERRAVLLVDDLDRLGPTSVAALGAATALPEVSLIATTGRPDDVLIADVEILAIPPLTVEDVGRLVRDQVGPAAEVDASTVEWLADMSGGNPLLLEYLLDEVENAGDTLDSRTIPPGPALRDLVRRRVGLLDAAGVQALEVAAVGLPDLPPAALVELTSRTGVEAAQAAGFLVSERDRHGVDRLGFRHGAAQRIVYDDLPAGRRAEAHHEVAARLRVADAPPAAVAHHALASHAVDPALAIDDARRAATAASAAGAHADAARWCERALAIGAVTGLGGEERRVALLVARGDALRLAGSPEHEQALFAAADAALALGQPDLLGDAAFAILQLGATTESGSHHERGLELAAYALAEVTDPEQRALIAAAASLAHSMTGNPALCRSLFLEAVAVPSAPATRGRILPFAYLALGHPQDLDHREAVTAELHAIADGSGDPVVRFEALQLSFSVALQRADGQTVRWAVSELEGLVPSVGDVGREWALLYMQAAVAHLDDRLDESERLAEEALTLFSPVSPSRAFATYGAQVLILRVGQGRMEELVETVQALVDDQPAVPAWHAALALATVDLDAERSRHHAALALERAEPDFTWLASHVIGGRAAAALRDAELARRYGDALAPWEDLVCWQGTCAYGPVATVAAQLSSVVGDRQEARRLRTLARRRAASLGAPVFERELAQRSWSGPEPD